jgi:hypothetical protein
MFAPLLIVIIGFCGLAMDVGRLYNRKVDLSGMAKAAALAAARELNGTPAGIVAAKARAKEAAESMRYQYFGEGSPIVWDEEALSFGPSPSRSGTWTAASSLDAASTTAAAELYYAKVDSDGLDETISTVGTYFMRILSSSLATVHVRESAVAGRVSINVTPVGICAMSPDKAAERKATVGTTTLSELVQYGFRRGVSYDLMQLNPSGTTPARYAIHPAVAPGTGGSTFSASMLGPFLCNGTMWVPRLSGGQIRVSALPSPAPLASLYPALNSRFNRYADSACESSASPPDGNIKEYAYEDTSGANWMVPATGKAAALTTTVRNKLETVADLPDNHPSLPASAGDYGPLWAYARAVKAPTPVTSEPSSGFAVFDATNAIWSNLYKSGTGVLATYPSSTATPYQSTSNSNFYTPPTVSTGTVAARQRRILNIPLLSCSPQAPSGTTAEVVAIGKFFMTVRATEERLIAEFAGLIPEQSLSGEVRLYP